MLHETIHTGSSADDIECGQAVQNLLILKIHHQCQECEQPILIGARCTSSQVVCTAPNSTNVLNFE